MSLDNLMKNYLYIPVTFLIIIIILAHFFPPIGYQWRENTISELASQGHDNAWIMRSGFIGFGIFLTLSLMASWQQYNQFTIGDAFIIIYGIAILLSGIFSTAPINSTLTYSTNEAKLHSLFATIAGINISIAIAWRIFSSHQPFDKILHFGFLIMITGLSFAFGLAENGTLLFGKGIIQRSLYLTGFIWLIIVGHKQSLSKVRIKTA